MKKKTLNQNRTLKSFIAFYGKHPELRFWQALSAWTKVSFILTSTHFDSEMFDKVFLKKNIVTVKDTYFWKGKKK